MFFIEHIIYGARHQGTKRDINFMIYQWRHLVFGFNQNQPPIEDALEDNFAQHFSSNDSDILTSV